MACDLEAPERSRGCAETTSPRLPQNPETKPGSLIIIDVIGTGDRRPAPVEPDAQWVSSSTATMRRDLITENCWPARLGPGRKHLASRRIIHFIPVTASSTALRPARRRRPARGPRAEPRVITSGCAKPGAVVDFSASLVVHEERTAPAADLPGRHVTPSRGERGLVVLPRPRGCGPLLLAGLARGARRGGIGAVRGWPAGSGRESAPAKHAGDSETVHALSRRSGRHGRRPARLLEWERVPGRSPLRAVQAGLLRKSSPQRKEAGVTANPGRCRPAVVRRHLPGCSSGRRKNVAAPASPSTASSAASAVGLIGP